MFQHILVPLDGSSRAEQALPVAVHIARASEGTLTVLRVVTPLLDLDMHPAQLVKRPELTQEADIARANDYLAQVARSPVLLGVNIQTEVLTGPAAQTVLLFTQLQHVDLIVMCSHGTTGFKRWALGSVAQQVARHSPTPVVVLREGGFVPTDRREEANRPPRVLVALDGSPLAEAALAPAAHLCASLAAPGQGVLQITRVLCLRDIEIYTQYTSTSSQLRVQGKDQVLAQARDYLNAVKRRLGTGELANLNLTFASSLIIDREGDVANTLLAFAERGETSEEVTSAERCDVIAMATHGRSGPERWVMGSVTERVLGATKLPLLIVRPRKREAGQVTVF